MSEHTPPSEIAVYSKSEADQFKKFKTLRKIADITFTGLRSRELRSGKRVEKMYNSIIALPQGGEVESPDPGVMAILQREDPIIEYLPISLDTQGELGRSQGEYDETNYQRALRFNLMKRLREEYPRKRLGVRAIQVGLNGSIHKGETFVLDAVDTARLGKEHELDTDITRLVPTESDGYIKPGFTAFYAEGNAAFRKKMKQTGRSEEIFPAILVYDMDHLARTDTSYEHSYSGNAKDALLVLYVVDAPAASVIEGGGDKSGNSISVSDDPFDGELFDTR
jgi:hypothetical protein